MARPKVVHPDGFAKLHNWYLLDGLMARMDPSAWKVLCCFLIRAMGSGSCSMSVSDVSKDTGVSERQVVRCLPELERLGVVSVQRRAGAKTRYELIRDQTHDIVSPLTSCHPCHSVTPDTMSPVGGQTHDIMSPPLPPRHKDKTQTPTPIGGGLFGEEEIPKAEPKRKTQSNVQSLVTRCFEIVGAPCEDWPKQLRAAKLLLGSHTEDEVVAAFSQYYTGNPYASSDLMAFRSKAPKFFAARPTQVAKQSPVDLDSEWERLAREG